jgi:RNA polymerase subunit RPABC4/transcription elongation factor Spt4
MAEGWCRTCRSLVVISRPSERHVPQCAECHSYDVTGDWETPVEGVEPGDPSADDIKLYSQLNMNQDRQVEYLEWLMERPNVG